MMFSPFRHGTAHQGRRFTALALCCLALMLAACSNSITATATPNPLMRGHWTPPTFAGLADPIGVLAFADGNQHVGYACTAVMNAATSATPTDGAAATATTASGAAATPTLAIPGKPTQAPTVNALQNAFWRTADGGLTWQTATLPTNAANLLCPVSAIVAADPANPNDVFFLAASGSLNLAQPTSILPGQLQYQLWRSQDGAQTWQQLIVPIAPNPLTPAIIEPYHLVIVAKGAAITLASNQSGADALFASSDGGKTWTQRLAPTTATGAPAGTYAFAGFAAGPDATLDALVVSAASGAGAPYAVWQSDASGNAWHALGAVTFTPPAGASAQTQIFAAPGGHVLYTLFTAASTNGAASTTNVLRSLDGGATWTAIGWPKTTATGPTAPGAGDIATLGANFAVDAAGNAYIAPPQSDMPPSQDTTAQDSAGFFAALVTASSWTSVASPKASGAQAIGLAVSAVAPPSGTTTPTVESAATVTTTAVATSTAISATGTPAATVSTPNPTPVVTTSTATTGLPTLWTNFGPLTQLGQHADNAGLFLNVLP